MFEVRKFIHGNIVSFYSKIKQINFNELSLN